MIGGAVVVNLWALAAAERLGRRAAALAQVTGVDRPNPFTGRRRPDLAEAWQRGHDEASATAQLGE